MTEKDIISENITDLDGLIKIEDYIASIKFSSLFTEHHRQLIVESI